MQWSKRHTTKRFTLLEILIATIVLVIMMGFLFQFVNSAQRLWSASENTTVIFDQAQLALQFLENDLMNAHFVSDQEYPGHAIPMGGYNDSNDNHKFFLVTQDSSNTGGIGTYLVMYTWSVENSDTESIGESEGNSVARTTGELARYVREAPVIESQGAHFFYGLDLSNNDAEKNTIISNVLKDLEADATKREVIATGIQSLQIEIPEGGKMEKLITAKDENYFFKTIPRILRITFNIYDASAVKILTDAGADSDVVEQKKSETARTFSKIIFLR